jgi:hypothetical protein
MIADPRIRGIGSIGGCGSCCCCCAGGVGGIGRSMDGKSIQSASSSSMLDVVVDAAVFVFMGRESAERERNVSLLRIDVEASG